MRLHVEGWAPEYGAPVEPGELPEPGPGELDLEVETRRWRPLPATEAPTAPAVERAAFVDGVRRVDARLTLDDPETGPVAGVCGSLAAGAVVWERSPPAARFGETRRERLAVLADGREPELPALGPELAYRAASVDGRDPGEPARHLQTRMRALEGELATDLAGQGLFVVADGPINPLVAQSVVGYVKSHRAAYLPPRELAVVAALGRGERTPLFVFDVERYPRYSWYLRLAEVRGGHSFSGVVRCECTGALALERAVELAGQTAELLPRMASALHLDPRAPQNLVPIAALERHLRRLLGDPGLVYRALRGALYHG